MLRAAGSHAVHLVLEALLGLAGLLVIAGSVLAWRLGQGPIDITGLARREAPRLGLAVTIGSAALTWEGFHDPDSALDIRWRNLAIRPDPAAPAIILPSGRVAVSVSHLFLLQIVPRRVAVDSANLQLTRAANGALSLDLGAAATPAGKPAEGRNAAALLHELASPPLPGSALGFLAQLRQVRVRNARVTIHDERFHNDWTATAGDIDLERQRDGRVRGIGGLDFSAGAARCTLTAQAELSPAGTHITAMSSPVSPAALAHLAQGLAGLAALDAPLSASLDATLGPKLDVTRLAAAAHLGPGTLRAGTGQVALRSADAQLETVPAPNHAPNQALGMRLTMLRVTLEPPSLSNGPAPTLRVQGDIMPVKLGLAGRFSLALDHAAFTDLAAYWPPGIGGGSRPWLVQNITDGLAQNGLVRGAFTAAPDFSNLALTALNGSISASGLTVYWLRPVPPIEHASALLTIDNPDQLHIDMPSGTQGPILLSAGHIKITGLSKKDQLGDIAVHAEAGMGDTVALLNHPRLRLLSRRPFPMANPSGNVATTINVHMPLDARVDFDSILISATAKLTQLHLGAVAAGRDLNNGDVSLNVDTNALRVAGTATVGGIPAHVALDMDFRDGPPGQILEHVTADGTASAAQAEAAGLPAGIMTGGTAALHVEYSDLRNGSGSVALAADMGAAALTTPIGWSKTVDQAASASARLSLLHDSLTGIDRIKADGPDLLIASHFDTASGSLRRITLDQVRIGRTLATGSLTLPAQAPGQGQGKGQGKGQVGAGRLAVVLRGPMLDASTFFKKRNADSAPEDDSKRGTPWSLNIDFDRVILAEDQALNQVHLRLDDDGLIMTDGQLRAGPTLQVRADLTPMAGTPSPGRKLVVDATEAGAVLLAAGVADNIRDGHLRLDASYNDTLPHSPLTGTATLEQFRITNAPAIGRLLKAMTLYGAVDLLRGPGLGFQKALIPFHWQQRVLRLNSARAFSASLGVTAQGDIDLRQHTADVTGTVVPAYFFNQLLGKIPVVGQLFSPEKGGGVFAAKYAVRGKLSDPKVSVNALSALTPGFLRNAFGPY